MRSHWEIIGQAIREARQETEQSQRNTAFRLGIKPSDYSKMEDGEDNPDVVLDALMRALVDRDEARAWAEAWTERLQRNACQHSIRAENAERERDEAREEVARLRESFRCLLNPQCAVEEAAK